MFYTYAHFTSEGRLFYIGKGSGDSKRAYDFRQRNVYWNNIVAKHGKPDVKIMAYWDEEWKAFAHERFLIANFRSKGYALCNMTDGGEGQLGMIPWNKGKECADLTKLKISESRKGIPAWNKGNPADPEVIEKIAAARRGQPSWNRGVACREETKALLREQRLGRSATWNIGREHSEETRRKCGVANIGRPASAKQRAIASVLSKGNRYAVGNTNNRKYKWIGTDIGTEEMIEFIGSEALNAAGFQHANVIKCINGVRKSHKGYTWVKELLGVANGSDT
jgi:hypothetical protein